MIQKPHYIPVRENYKGIILHQLQENDVVYKIKYSIATKVIWITPRHVIKIYNNYIGQYQYSNPDGEIYIKKIASLRQFNDVMGGYHMFTTEHYLYRDLRKFQNILYRKDLVIKHWKFL